MSDLDPQVLAELREKTLSPGALAVINRAADFISQITDEGEVNTYVLSGRVILWECYNKDWSEWKKRNRGDARLEHVAAALRERGKTRWSPTKLYRAVCLYEQAEAFTGLKQWPYLGVTHFYAVQNLPWERQRALLNEANEKRWTTDQLAKAAGAERPERAPTLLGASRKAARALNRIEQVIDECDDELTANLAAAGADEPATKALADSLAQVLARIDEVQAQLAPGARRKAAEG